MLCSSHFHVKQCCNLWPNITPSEIIAIGNIEDFLTTVQWDQLGTDPTFSQQEKTNVYNELQQLHKDSGTYKSNISTLTGDLGTARSDIDLLNTRLDNWDTTTEVGDVVGLDDVLKDLKKDYQSDIKDVETQLGDYLKTGDFNTRMTDNLDALGATLRGEFGADIKNTTMMVGTELG